MFYPIDIISIPRYQVNIVKITVEFTRKSWFNCDA